VSMRILCLEVGPLMANCYIVACGQTGRAMVIDPGGDADRILAAIREAGLTVDIVADTHCHPDHISANCDLRDGLTATQEAPARIMIHPADRESVENPPMQWLLIGMRPDPCMVDATFDEGDVLAVGGLRVKVMHLPGHSPGGVALVADGAVFTGDTLFAGSVGRTDLPGGSWPQLRDSLRRLITELPGETVVYPGHGPASTISDEVQMNEWLQDL